LSCHKIESKKKHSFSWIDRRLQQEQIETTTPTRGKETNRRSRRINRCNKMMQWWTWTGILLFLLHSTGLVTTTATAASVVDDAGPQGSSQSLPPISRCVSTMLLFDVNEDRWLGHDEFVDVINRLLDGCEDRGGRGNINDNKNDGVDAIDALYDEVRCFCLDYVDVDACCDWGVDLSGTYPAAYLNQVCHRIQAHVMEHDGGVNGGVDCNVENGAPIGTAATPANTTKSSNGEETSAGVLDVTPDSITTITTTTTSGGKLQRPNNRRTVWIALVVGAFAAICFIVVFGMVSRRQRGKKTSAAADGGDEEDTIQPRPATTTTAASHPRDDELLNRPPSPLELLQESSGVPLGILRRTPDVPEPIGTSTYIPGAALSIMVSGLLHANSEVQIVDHHRIVDIDRPGTIHEVSFEESTTSSLELA
jgi:hypothetical protein